MHPKRVKDIVLACVVLHNMLRAERGAGGARDLGDEEILCGMDDGDPPGGHANNAKEQRDYLKDWFNDAGAVPWQGGRV